MADTAQRVKEKLSIVDVVQPYVKITRAGKYWKGLSPFNKEKTPSFYVNPDRGSYYCFSSSQGGDIFTFIEKMEGVDFKGALKILAEKAGIPLEYSKSESGGTEKRDRLREAMARAEQYFARNLSDDSAAYAYALSRKLTPETIQAWSLGFAPDSWRGLLEELTQAGFTNAELVGAGLIKEADGKPGTWYDRFRNRLMFPIRDGAGRTVAFTGRSLDPNDQAKYLNSPETELFKKSSLLFAMDRAKDAIRTRGYALLMEGQMDVIHAHQAGFQNAVALSGTALSSEHLALMKRYSDNVLLCLDADRAGLAATEKHALAALAAGLRVKAVRLPLGKDPADLISEDPKDFAKRVADGKPVVEFFLEALAEDTKDQHKLVIDVERIVLPLLAAIPSPMEKEHFVSEVARAISSTPEAVRAGLLRIARGAVPVERQAPMRPNAMPARASDEAHLRAVRDTYPDTPLAERIESEYARIVGQPLGEEASPEQVLFETGILYGEAPTPDAADDVLIRLDKEARKRAYRDACKAREEAERTGDAEKVRAAEIQEQAALKALSALH